LTGGSGQVGGFSRWTSYREFFFDSNRIEIQASESSKVSEIAAYMNQNPSIRIGIDRADDDLSERRARSIRTALINAGVPSSKIQSGKYSDAYPSSDRRVEVLVRSDS
jgi:outer membrane protein OmpA-like peptidoglycan-associated protein